MDEVGITPSALTAEETAALYAYQAAWYDVINQHSIYVDADLPTVDVSLIPASVGIDEKVFVIGADDATSPITAVEYSIDGGGWQAASPDEKQPADSGAWLFYFQQPAGVHSVVARATDSVGNITESAAATVEVDAQPPVVTINSDSAPIRVTDSLALDGTVADTGSGVPANGVNVRTSDHTGAPVSGNQAATIDQTGNWQATQSFVEAPYGVYSVTASAEDEIGNAATASAVFNLDGLPPYADVTDGENYIAYPATKTLSGVAGEIPYPSDGRTLHLHFESGSGLWADGSETNYLMQCEPAGACPTSGIGGARRSRIV